MASKPNSTSCQMICARIVVAVGVGWVASIRGTGNFSSQKKQRIARSFSILLGDLLSLFSTRGDRCIRIHAEVMNV